MRLNVDLLRATATEGLASISVTMPEEVPPPWFADLPPTELFVTLRGLLGANEKIPSVHGAEASEGVPKPDFAASDVDIPSLQAAAYDPNTMGGREAEMAWMKPNRLLRP